LRSRTGHVSNATIDLSPTTLLVVCATPPATSGERTRNRCELLGRLLGAESVKIENLFAFETESVVALSEVGRDSAGWLLSRERLSVFLEGASAIVVAYGVSEPSGVARFQHREQVVWLAEEFRSRSLEPLQIGDGPRHPSRWQRWTSRAHPRDCFEEALAKSLMPWSPNRIPAGEWMGASRSA
jgi:hypothetical protein